MKLKYALIAGLLASVLTWNIYGQTANTSKQGSTEKKSSVVKKKAAAKKKAVTKKKTVTRKQAGVSNAANKTKTDMSSVMGKPAYESTVDSLITKVWIISQKKNMETKKTTLGKNMTTMKDKNVGMDTATKDAIMTGTHYFIFDVKNIRNGKALADSSAKVEIVSPTRKISSVMLHPMMNHFGSGVSLDEKGEYLFTVNLDIGAEYKTTQFKYRVR